MRAWWSVLLVPQRRTHLHSSSDCSLLCFEEPTTNSESGPLFSRISSIFFEISSYAWSHEIRFHLPPSSFIGYFRRCESCVMPCSRTEAPLAQCAPRLIDESNTGSWRTHTPFCTTASMAQPTEQWVHTVRLNPSLPSRFFASARSIIEKGSCDATAPAPTPIPERFRKVRRSIVFARALVAASDRRDCGAALLLALRVRSMRTSSDLRGAVVVGDVLGGLIGLRGALVLRILPGVGGTFRDDCRRGGCSAAHANGHQEISAGKFGFLVGHGSSYAQRFIYEIRAKVTRKFLWYKRE